LKANMDWMFTAWFLITIVLNIIKAAMSINLWKYIQSQLCDRMVVGYTTTYAINAYHHWCCEFKSRSGRLCDEVCHWVSPGPPVSSTNKTDCHDITEILLKVVLNTIKLTNRQI
jgi:hypothetical protein